MPTLISSTLKPLYANLRRIQIGEYLHTEEFNLLMLELGFDEIWESVKREISRNKRVFIAGFHDDREDEEALIRFASIWLPAHPANCVSFILFVLDRYVKWSPVKKNLDAIIKNIRGLGVEAEAINRFETQYDIIQATKPGELPTEPTSPAPHDNTKAPASSLIERIFISHASKDHTVVEEIIDLLEIIGVTPKQIFCSSFPGYSIEFGEDFLQRIKSELNGNVLVLFVLTENFYGSPVCLCEMGAAWVQTRQHIPIIVPPLSYDEVRGVIPLTQGLKVNEPLKWNLFKEQLEGIFNCKDSVSASVWERKRDKAIRSINDKIAEGKPIPPPKRGGGLQTSAV